MTFMDVCRNVITDPFFSRFITVSSHGETNANTVGRPNRKPSLDNLTRFHFTPHDLFQPRFYAGNRGLYGRNYWGRPPNFTIHNYK